MSGAAQMEETVKVSVSVVSEVVTSGMSMLMHSSGNLE